MTPALIRELARDCNFELAGVTPALPAEDRARYHDWVAAGSAGRMGYLTDHRAALRDDPRNLLPTARSIVCVGKLYQTPFPHTTRFDDPARAWISRYAWGDDYHQLMRRDLERLDALLHERADKPFDSRICVDTAPILERTYARLAGLGWIGKNTCLINQRQGSWFFLGELLVSLELAPDAPPPDRCGTCTRCIDACPTAAIVPGKGLDANLCISYFTIELRGEIPEAQRSAIGPHVFGCDICQDVCPWNRGIEKRRADIPLPEGAEPHVDLVEWLESDPQVLRARYERLYVPKNDGRFLQRNAAIARRNEQVGA
jgi:epoxyqueuosine reductase